MHVEIEREKFILFRFVFSFFRVNLSPKPSLCLKKTHQIFVFVRFVKFTNRFFSFVLHCFLFHSIFIKQIHFSMNILTYTENISLIQKDQQRFSISLVAY